MTIISLFIIAVFVTILNLIMRYLGYSELPGFTPGIITGILSYAFCSLVYDVNKILRSSKGKQ